LGVELKEEYNQLVADGNDHIIYTNRDEIPDMKPVDGTLKLFQLEGEKKSSTNWRVAPYYLRLAMLLLSIPPVSGTQQLSL